MYEADEIQRGETLRAAVFMLDSRHWFDRVTVKKERERERKKRRAIAGEFI